jgi:hypothetical protein
VHITHRDEVEAPITDWLEEAYHFSAQPAPATRALGAAKTRAAAKPKRAARAKAAREPRAALKRKAAARRAAKTPPRRSR